ncbi:MAG: chemotaxis protein CheC [Gammaproteobacteria bacterium]|nr:chemotaxis protein CheC [Gammaproteobacteria bacterium]
MINLTELQQDGIQELLNIAMANAGASLSQMVDEEVMLSVPSVRVVAVTEINELVGNPVVNMSAVSQSFNGTFSGHAMLLFPEKKSLELVWALLKGSVPKEEIAEMEGESLSEVGNVIINACLRVLSNVLKEDINSGLPQFRQGTHAEILIDLSGGSRSDTVILFMPVDFRLKTKDIDGYVAIVMDVGEIANFLNKVDHFINEI